MDLSALGSAPLPLVGGKALNLGKLTAAGFRVPRVFCLTTVAYRKAAPAELDALAARLDAARPGPSNDDEQTTTTGENQATATPAPASQAAPGWPGPDRTSANWPGRRGK